MVLHLIGVVSSSFGVAYFLCSLKQIVVNDLKLVHGIYVHIGNRIGHLDGLSDTSGCFPPVLYTGNVPLVNNSNDVFASHLVDVKEYGLVLNINQDVFLSRNPLVQNVNHHIDSPSVDRLCESLTTSHSKGMPKIFHIKGVVRERGCVLVPLEKSYKGSCKVEVLTVKTLDCRLVELSSCKVNLCPSLLCFL